LVEQNLIFGTGPLDSLRFLLVACPLDAGPPSWLLGPSSSMEYKSEGILYPVL